MSKSPTPKRGEPRPYHHGNLRRAMIDAAVQLVKETGAENVTIREAARRAGVSSGAPFRHFATKQDLMTAVAEDAMAKLRLGIEQRITGSEECPLTRLLAMADAYIHWAVQHPTQYRVLGDRTLVDFYGSEALLADNRWIRETMNSALSEAEAQGLLRPCDLTVVALQSRALAYGLARMHVDAHLKEFGIPKAKARGAMYGVLRDFILSLARDPTGLRRRLA
jgi:AcrR family transcriptional regulator